MGIKLLAILPTMLLFSTPLLGDARVLESNVAAYPVGVNIADYKKIELPPDGQLRILDLKTNETRLLKGSGARSMRDIPIGSSRGRTEPDKP